MDFSPALPSGKSYSAVHLRTVAYQCKPLVNGPDKWPTLKAKHLLLLSESDSVVLGVEIYVYLTFKKENTAKKDDSESDSESDSVQIENSKIHRSIFVSKADTTGLGTRFSTAAVVEIFLAYLLSIDPNTYVAGARWRTKKPETKSVTESEFALVNDLLSLSQRVKEDAAFYKFLTERSSTQNNNQELTQKPIGSLEVVEDQVALFTRSAQSYLFPNSEKNTGKHIADGNQLFKWWLAVLGRVLDSSWTCRADIPGADRAAVQKFLPKTNWASGSIFVDSDASAPALHAIPLFPDDPKGRFLEHLIVEGRSRSLNAEQFWSELGFRQEFRLGNVVGIIGCKRSAENVKFGPNDKATVVTLGQYKKIRDLLKGEDYNVVEDIQNLWNSSLEELCKRIGVDLEKVTVVGKREAVAKAEKPVVNVLAAKRAPVNNLTGLVKRKAK